MLNELEDIFTGFGLGMFLGMICGLPLGVVLLVWGMM